MISCMSLQQQTHPGTEMFLTFTKKLDISNKLNRDYLLLHVGNHILMMQLDVQFS